MLVIIKHGLKTHFKEKRWVFFQMIFPIFLMSILGSVFSVSMGNVNDSSTVKVSYYTQGNYNKQLDNLIDYYNNKGTKIVKADNIASGKELVSNQDGIFISSDGEKTEVYYTSTSVEEAEEALLYLKDNNEKEILENSSSENKVNDIEIESNGINSNKVPNSYQYYGIVELTMTILFVTLFPLGLVGADRRREMKKRISMSGISNLQYFMGRIISSFILSIVILIPGFIFSIVILKANWGSNPIKMVPYLLSLSFFAATLGTVIGYIVKQKEKSEMLLQGMIIPIFAFLGGAFIKIPTEGSTIYNIATGISPLKWINEGIFQAVYSNKFTYLHVSFVLNLALSVILLMILFGVLRKEEKIS